MAVAISVECLLSPGGRHEFEVGGRHYRFCSYCHTEDKVKEVEKIMMQHIPVTPDILPRKDETAPISTIPPKPKGTKNIARHYDANRAQIEADVETMGVRKTLAKWKMSQSGWYNLKKRWAQMDICTEPDLPKSTIQEMGEKLGFERRIPVRALNSDTPLCLREIIGLSIEIKLEEAGTLKLLYTHNSADSLSQEDRVFLVGLINLLVRGE